MNLKHLATPLLIAGALLLAACSKSPMDTPLVMGKGVEAYKLDLGARVEKMTELELEAYNWAVDGVTYEELLTLAPNKTPREIIRMGVSNSKAIYEREIQQAEKAVAEYEAILQELKKIAASDTSLVYEKTFFGFMPKLTFSVVNDSRFKIGALNWNAWLFLDGADKSEAGYRLHRNYKQTKLLAMESGKAYVEKHDIGNVAGDFAWTSQVAMQAKRREVQVEPRYESIEDMDGNKILPKSPIAWRDSLKKRAEMNERYSSI